MSLWRNIKRYIKRKIENEKGGICEEMVDKFVMLSDGSVTTCCLDGYGINTYGNLHKMTYEECINSKKFKKLLANMCSSKICRSCQHRIKNPTEEQLKEHFEKLKKGHRGTQVEIAASCNYACTECPANNVHEKRNPMPNLDIVYENLKNILPKLEYINCYHFGEPLLNTQFMPFLEKIRKANPTLRIGISTNGMLMTKEKAQKIVDNAVDWIVVSLHGGPRTENLLKYANRGANYETVIKNIKQLKEIRDNSGKTLPKISMRAILFNWNDTDELMDEFRQAAKEIGIDNPCNGDQNQDNYHWILDGASPQPRASQRFLYGNEEYNRIKASKELGL